jgi:hypothetical protein
MRAGVAILAGVLLLVSGCGGSSSSSGNTTKLQYVTDMDGFHCPASKTKYGRCPDNIYYGKTPRYVRAQKQAAARAQARMRAREAAAAKRRAAAHAAYVRAANAWHQGYYQYSPALWYRWRNDLDCSDYSNGCWRIEVVTRDGCSSLFVEASELRGNTNVGDLIDSRDNVTPKTPVLLELDSTVENNGPDVASAPTITCGY